jgi:hypothetical protein
LSVARGAAKGIARKLVQQNDQRKGAKRIVCPIKLALRSCLVIIQKTCAKPGIEIRVLLEPSSRSGIAPEIDDGFKLMIGRFAAELGHLGSQIGGFPF